MKMTVVKKSLHVCLMTFSIVSICGSIAFGQGKGAVQRSAQMQAENKKPTITKHSGAIQDHPQAKAHMADAQVKESSGSGSKQASSEKDRQKAAQDQREKVQNHVDVHHADAKGPDQMGKTGKKDE